MAWNDELLFRNHHPACASCCPRELAMKLFRSRHIGTMCRFDILESAEINPAPIYTNLSTPMTIASDPRHTLKPRSVRYILALVLQILCARAHPQIAAAIIKTVSIYMVNVIAIAFLQAKNQTMQITGLRFSVALFSNTPNAIFETIKINIIKNDRSTAFRQDLSHISTLELEIKKAISLLRNRL
jgi:hypothetical protein